MANRLALETSPYLLQHAQNPVNWFPWGEEAFAEARERDVPLFLSVGYSTCHWCHVMARESFDDPATASLLNEHFVSIKVDREERPDVDAVYAADVQAMTDKGGWPMSVFLTHEGEPFYVGSYWPKEARDGLPSFASVVEAVARAWQDRRHAITASAQAISARLEGFTPPQSGGLELGVSDDAARTVLGQAWDRRNGGFGTAPKFPHAMAIEWLLHRTLRTGDEDALAAAVQALDAMARGGIHDQLGGGFARYTTDGRWLVPHFEKMLYDNALLLPAYALGAVLTGRADLARTARTTARYLLDGLRLPHGAFAAATDAETEGAEGGYVVWSFEELARALQEADADPVLWAAFLGATEEGNWEGTNVLHEPHPRERFAADAGLPPEEFDAEWERIRSHLRAWRAWRTAPAMDTKVLTDWNALAVRGLVRAGHLLGEPEWVAAAARTADFLHRELVVDGRLHHVWKDGAAAVEGFLLDHAALALADLELFQVTGDTVRFERGVALAERANSRFGDDDGGWYQTPSDDALLYRRQRTAPDDAVPSGTSVMVEVSLVLAALTGDLHHRDRARAAVRAQQHALRESPTRHGWLLRQVEFLRGSPREVAVVGAPGPGREALMRMASVPPRPGAVVVVSDPGHGDRVPLLVGRGEIQGLPTAYVCQDLACQRPVSQPDQLAALLADSERLGRAD
ncbi:thioredoxin domain-containing protein [Sinomonas notoginsengisoli]|uniref:thioredoxin domain-containing protein n=1 Tax=Sinomonas notoginsengisoli TaxID=1457311 RepID=UPI001F29FF2B|nr:thioredoxin domain-containing protein [Sinomonas notoginsengisoli]